MTGTPGGGGAVSLGDRPAKGPRVDRELAVADRRDRRLRRGRGVRRGQGPGRAVFGHGDRHGIVRRDLRERHRLPDV